MTSVSKLAILLPTLLPLLGYVVSLIRRSYPGPDHPLSRSSVKVVVQTP